MREYSRQDILDWAHKSVGVERVVNNSEIQTRCPRCGHNFYLNMSKLLSFCHYDKCHWSPSFEELVKHVGFAPREAGSYRRPRPPEPQVEIRMPFGSRVPSGEVLEYLHKRELTDQDIIRFNVQESNGRVVVPVYENGELVSYVSRLVKGNGKRYLYPKGGRHMRTLFGWDEVKNWTHIVLVENTFVSIWLRNKINATTNFGSHLSNYQVDKILQSKINSVAILWDEGAAQSAAKACRRLQARCQAAYGVINGQPDDYPLDTLTGWAKLLHQSAQRGKTRVDLRGN